MQDFLVCGFLVFVVFTGALFFWGGDILLVFFALTLAGIFFIMSACSANAPYSSMGAQRELMQMMAYEPMVLLTAIGFYIATGSFSVKEIAQSNISAICLLPGFFIGFLYILTIKFRKSPYDISTSHHAHQEMVRGLTTELSGNILALVTLSPVSYTHLDVYKRQEELNTVAEQYGIDRDRIVIQLNQMVEMSRSDSFMDTIRKLRGYGFHICLAGLELDRVFFDFLDCGVDSIKLRHDLIRHVDKPEGKTVIQSIMNFCGQLHLKVVCMGVENEEQAEYLKSIGCDYATGFYYYYPVSQDSFDELEAKQN